MACSLCKTLRSPLPRPVRHWLEARELAETRRRRKRERLSAEIAHSAAQRQGPNQDVQ